MWRGWEGVVDYGKIFEKLSGKSKNIFQLFRKKKNNPVYLSTYLPPTTFLYLYICAQFIFELPSPSPTPSPEVSNYLPNPASNLKCKI